MKEKINQKNSNCANPQCNLAEKCKCKQYFCGDRQEEGFYVCENYGQKVYLNDGDKLMECPRCSNKCFSKE